MEYRYFGRVDHARLARLDFKIRQKVRKVHELRDGF